MRVSDPEVILTFSERVDEASVRRALSVSPSTPAVPDVRVRGRDLHIDLGDSLRPDITYVLTLGTELRDLRGVAVPAPITLAFATGDRIDQGRITGVVRDAETGAAGAGLAIQAYRLAGDSAAGLPNPAVDAADYRTQSATDGTFQFGHLRLGTYFVIALSDRNRDGLAGAGEAYAAPPDRDVVAADTGSTERVALLIADPDTTGPALRGARAVDARTVAARFDEPVHLQADALGAFTLEDSLAGTAVTVDAAWTAGDAREVLLATESLARRSYRLRFAGGDAVADSVGNPAPPASASFSAPSDPAIPAVQFVRFLPEARVAPDSAFTLLPGERVGVRFSRPIAPDVAAARVVVLDESGSGLRFDLQPESPTTLSVNTSAPTFRVQVDDSTNMRRYRLASTEELGAIVGRVVSAGGGAARIEVALEGGARRLHRSVETDADGAFAVAGLPSGSYRIRVHLDSDGNGRWSGGRLFPYAPPEPIGWLPGPVRVRSRWETDLGEVHLVDGAAIAEGVDPDDQQGR